MVDEIKNLGDEDFIHHMVLQEEPTPHENNILDGYIILDDEKIPFKKNGILDGNMSIIMPAIFEIMPEDMVSTRYGDEDRPDVIYTFFDDDIYFTLTYDDDLPSEDEDIPGVKDLVEKMVMRSFPTSKVIESTIVKGSGGSVAYFDFVSDTYNMIFFFSHDGCLILGSFECLVSDKNDWKPVFLQMIKSIEEQG